MKIKKLFIVISLFILILSSIPKVTAAYSDNSIYRIETGGFVGEENVKNALYKLQSDTGWYAVYQSTGKFIPYYQIISGEIYGENNVKEQLMKLESASGIDGTYSPIGSQEPYQRVISGGFDKNVVENVLERFTQSTGLSATYEPIGESIAKERIVSGGFYGENTVQNVAKQFTEATGIPASYEPTGEQPEYKQVISGGFYGEENTKSIMQDFINSTGVNATYEPIQFTETYNIITGGFEGEQTVQSIVAEINNDLGISATYVPTELDNIYKIKFESLSEDMMTRVSNYLKDKGWWFSSTSNGKVGLVFRIVSDSLLDQDKLNQALNYFTSRNWWASINSTGTKENLIFRVVSDPVEEKATLNNGLNFFKQRGWWATTQATSESYYSYYRIVSEPLLEKDKLEKGLAFFKENGWWTNTILTGDMGYTTFRIVTNPILGAEQANLAAESLRSSGYEARSQATGKQEEIFNIVTGGFVGYENAVANARMLTEKYGWWVTTVLIKSGTNITTTTYDMTLEDMVEAQMNVRGTKPQTDKYRNNPAWVSSQYIDSNNRVTASTLNVRGGPGTTYEIVAQLNSGTQVTVLETNNGWSRILLTWRNAKKEDVEYYLNPMNFSQDTDSFYQFLDLSKVAGVNAAEVNEKVLYNKGIFVNQAQAFITAASTYNINEIYLISHALLETGNGTSSLAKGVTVSSVNGQAVTPRVVYNMYGIGAVDGSALRSGSEYAYEQGWFTKEAAIIGGAKFIAQRYINHATYKQNTLYKMRWNPANPGTHQYATDIGWAYKQVSNISRLYNLIDNYTLYYDVPQYK